MALEECISDFKASTEIRTYKYDTHVRPRLNNIYEQVSNTRKGADI